MLNFIKRYWPTALATLILLTALTGVYAKYVMDQALTGQASITAKLGEITLLEHKAIKQNDGSYTLDANNTVQSNTYSVVIPGLDIPKDPYVQITNKSPIAAYVFLKIETDNLKENGLTYTLNAHWKPADGYTNVYVYSAQSNGDWTPVQVTGDNTGTITISVLDGDQVIVSQKLNKEATGLELTFSACMKQYVDGQTVAQIYGNT